MTLCTQNMQRVITLFLKEQLHCHINGLILGEARFLVERIAAFCGAQLDI